MLAVNHLHRSINDPLSAKPNGHGLTSSFQQTRIYLPAIAINLIWVNSSLHRQADWDSSPLKPQQPLIKPAPCPPRFQQVDFQNPVARAAEGVGV